MSVLTSLKLCSFKTRNALSPTQLRRNKLCARIDEQIAMATAANEGRDYVTSRTRIVKDKESGESKAVTQARRVRAWWFSGDKGKLYVQLRYGARVLELAKGKNSVEVSSKEQLVSVLSTLKKAAEDGELDAQLDVVGSKAT